MALDRRFQRVVVGVGALTDFCGHPTQSRTGRCRVERSARVRGGEDVTEEAFEIGATPFSVARADHRAERGVQLGLRFVRAVGDDGVDRDREPVTEGGDEARGELRDQAARSPSGSTAPAGERPAHRVRLVDRGLDDRGPGRVLLLGVGKDARRLDPAAAAADGVEELVVLVLEQALGRSERGHDEWREHLVASSSGGVVGIGGRFVSRVVDRRVDGRVADRVRRLGVGLVGCRAGVLARRWRSCGRRLLFCGLLVFVSEPGEDVLGPFGRRAGRRARGGRSVFWWWTGVVLRWRCVVRGWGRAADPGCQLVEDCAYPVELGDEFQSAPFEVVEHALAHGAGFVDHLPTAFRRGGFCFAQQRGGAPVVGVAPRFHVGGARPGRLRLTRTRGGAVVGHRVDAIGRWGCSTVASWGRLRRRAGGGRGVRR